MSMQHLRVRLISSAILLVSISSGCSSVQYHAETLPNRLRVGPRGNPQTVDLSRLASSSVSNELISEGDVLEITISAGLSDADMVTFPVRVNDDGTASLPDIGRIPLAGLELDGSEAAVTAACIHRGLYRSPHVTITMKRQRVNRVTVIGAVNDPGVHELPRKSSNLLAAIVAAKGLAEDAGENVEIRTPSNTGNLQNDRDAIAAASHVSLMGHSSVGGSKTAGSEMVSSRSSPQQSRSIRVNLVSAAKEGSGGYTIADGSVVMVEKRAPTPIQVMGLVKQPGRHDYPVGQDLRVLDAIALAGGLRSSVADKVYVIRPIKNQIDPAVIQVSVRKAKRSGRSNLRLAPGDLVSVEQTPATVFLDAVQILRLGFGANLGLGL
jgi:polysaccharide export outer membrane protein